jgi:hypothetical protein
VLSYRINGPFVEVTVEDGHSLKELRTLYRQLLADPLLPATVLMVFDARAGTGTLSDAERRARLDAFVEILCPRVLPVCAVVTPTISTVGAKSAQTEASQRGLRVGLFSDMDAARRWLGVYADTPCA